MPATEPDEGHPAPEDIALIAAYRDGDVSAFDELFRRYHGRVRGICLRYIGDDMIAEDLVQETFYNLIRAIDRIDETFNVSAWIHRIAVNICQDELRRRARRAQHIEGGEESEEQMLRLADTDRTGSPEGALEISNMRQLVWEVAKRLPERQRMVLTLRELQGLSYASIARVMGISESAVETLLHRARKRFKEQYLMLESPPEEEGTCAVVAQLLNDVGQQHLLQAQRRMIGEHLEQCAWCRGQFMDLETGAEARAAASG